MKTGFQFKIFNKEVAALPAIGKRKIGLNQKAENFTSMCTLSVLTFSVHYSD